MREDNHINKCAIPGAVVTMCCTGGLLSIVQMMVHTGGTGNFIQRLALPEDVRSGETCRLATADMVIVLRGLLFSVGVGYFCR